MVRLPEQTEEGVHGRQDTSETKGDDLERVLHVEIFESYLDDDAPIVPGDHHEVVDETLGLGDGRTEESALCVVKLE